MLHILIKFQKDSGGASRRHYLFGERSSLLSDHYAKAELRCLS